MRALGALAGGDPVVAARLGREWRLDRSLQSALEAAGADGDSAYRAAQLTFELLVHVPWFAQATRRRPTPDRVFAHWLGDGAVRRLLDVHTHADVEWLRQESFEEWIAWLAVAAAGPEPAAATRKRASRKGAAAATPVRDTSKAAEAWAATLVARARESGWRTDRLIAAPPASDTAAEPKTRRRVPAARGATTKSRVRR